MGGMVMVPEGYKAVLDPTSDMLQAAIEVRAEAWAHQTGAVIGAETWRDELDNKAYHVLITKAQGRVVASGRLSIHTDLATVPNAATYRFALTDQITPPFGIFGRLTVNYNHRGLGLPKVIDALRIEKAKQLKLRHILAATSVTHRVEMLRASGFQADGPGLPYTEGPLAQAIRAATGNAGSKTLANPIILKLNLPTS